MNMNEIKVQSSPTILMERQREKACWRINETDCLAFINHLKNFFMTDQCSILNPSWRVLYIDIDEKDFCMVSYVFATVEVKIDRITVKGIFPQTYLPLWNEHIILNFCVEEKDCENVVSLRLELKTGKQKYNRSVEE